MSRIITYLFFLLCWIASFQVVGRFSEEHNWLWWGLAVFVIVLPFVLFRFTTISNGFAIAVMRLGEEKKIKIRWRGHKLDDNGDVVEDPEATRHIFGGLVVVGWAFLDSVHKYILSWTSVEQDGSLTEHKKEELDRVLLMPKQYHYEIKDAEDKRLMPLIVKGSIWLQVVNPGKALFKIEDYLASTIAQMVSAIRDALTQNPYEELTTMMEDIASQIFDDEEERRETILEDYGVKVVDLAIKNIDPQREEDRQATLLPIQAEFKKKAAITKAEADAEIRKIAAEAEAPAELLEQVGMIIALNAHRRGLSVNDYLKSSEAGIAAEIEDLKEYTQELHKQLEMGEIGAFKRIEYENTGSSNTPSNGNASGSSGGLFGGGGGGLNLNGEVLKELLVLGKALFGEWVASKQKAPSAGAGDSGQEAKQGEGKQKQEAGGYNPPNISKEEASKNLSGIYGNIREEAEKKE